MYSVLISEQVNTDGDFRVTMEYVMNTLVPVMLMTNLSRWLAAEHVCSSVWHPRFIRVHLCRSKLETSIDQWTELIDRCQGLIDYLTARENALLAARPVGSNVTKVAKQLSNHQVTLPPM